MFIGNRFFPQRVWFIVSSHELGEHTFTSYSSAKALVYIPTMHFEFVFLYLAGISGFMQCGMTVSKTVNIIRDLILIIVNLYRNREYAKIQPLSPTRTDTGKLPCTSRFGKCKRDRLRMLKSRAEQK